MLYQYLLSTAEKMVTSLWEQLHTKNVVLLSAYLYGMLLSVSSVTSVHMFALMQQSDLFC